MKKGLFYALCLGALAMSASCQKTEQNSTEKGNSVVFTAQFDNEKNVDVRTVLDETGKRSLWNKDEIRVLNGENMEGSAQVYSDNGRKCHERDLYDKGCVGLFHRDTFHRCLSCRCYW